MADENLVRLLLRKLEAEKGCPVQLRIETADTINQSKEYFGDLAKRRVIVKRVEGLDDKYLTDVQLIEGEYERFELLQDKVKELNVLWDYHHATPLTRRVYDFVREEMGIKHLMGHGIAANFKGYEQQRNWVKLDPEPVYQFLQREGIKYFENELICTYQGIYNKLRSAGVSITRDITPDGKVIDNEPKVANIEFELIK